jgi:hypothetical protein
MKFINEFKELEELLRKADSLISPISYHDTVKWLMSKKNRAHLFELNPKCVFIVNVGTQIHHIPICNRSAMIDPKVIDFSLKLAYKLKDLENADQDQIKKVIIRLTMLRKKFSNDIPKPEDIAAKKGNITKVLNKIMI